MGLGYHLPRTAVPHFEPGTSHWVPTRVWTDRQLGKHYLTHHLNPGGNSGFFVNILKIWYPPIYMIMGLLRVTSPKHSKDARMLPKPISVSDKIVSIAKYFAFSVIKRNNNCLEGKKSGFFQKEYIFGTSLPLLACFRFNHRHVYICDTDFLRTTNDK